jgi:membrane-associated phospholipid phosphatase
MKLTTVLQSISNVCHPLMALTYAALLLMFFSPLQALPIQLRWFIIGEVAFYTLLLPMICITILYKMHIIGHWALRNRVDRAIPLGINALAYGICSYALTAHEFLPGWMLSVYWGATVMSTISWIISFWWKISAHAMGMTAVATLSLIMSIWFPTMMPLWAALGLIVLTGFVCSIRVYLGRHTLAQVAAGAALGGVVLSIAMLCFH